jgi:hypothetical protein
LGKHHRKSKDKKSRRKVKSPRKGQGVFITDEMKLGPREYEAKYATLSPATKHLLLITRLKEMFEIEITNGMLVFKNLPSPESVHTIADEIVNYWPKDYKIIPPDNENKLRLLFWGRDIVKCCG